MLSRSYSCGCVDDEAPEELIVAKQYVFNTSQKVGCTQILRGSCRGLRHVSTVSGKVIQKKDKDSFLQLEGRVLAILARCPHDNVAKVIDTTECCAGNGVLVLEPMYQDLHSYVRGKERLSEVEARPIFSQLVQGVAHCHDRRIVLRDIKLGKIFFTSEDRRRVVIGDLDGAQVITASDWRLKDQKGSPAYVSPEVLTCQPYDGAPADVWSLGVVLYVMLTGSYPFQEHRPGLLFQKIHQASAAVKFPSYLSPAVVELLRSLLNRDAPKRPTAEELLQNSWMLDSTDVDCLACPQCLSPSSSRPCSARSSPVLRQFTKVSDALSEDQVVPPSNVTCTPGKGLKAPKPHRAREKHSKSPRSCSRKRKRSLDEPATTLRSLDLKAVAEEASACEPVLKHARTDPIDLPSAFVIS